MSSLGLGTHWGHMSLQQAFFHSWQRHRDRCLAVCLVLSGTQSQVTLQLTRQWLVLEDVLGLLDWTAWPLLCPSSPAGPIILARGRGEEEPASGRVVGEEALPCSWEDSKRKGEVEGRKGHGTSDARPGGHSGECWEVLKWQGMGTDKKCALRRANVLSFAKSLA